MESCILKTMMMLWMQQQMYDKVKKSQDHLSATRRGLIYFSLVELELIFSS